MGGGSAGSAESTTVPIVGWVTGGLAVGAFAYFGLSGRSDVAELRRTCAPACSDAARDDVRTQYVVADLSLLTAIVFGGVSAFTVIRANAR